MSDNRIKELFARSVLAQADDARQRRAWKDGMRPMPPRIEWDNGNGAPHQVLPPAIVEAPTNEVAPKSAGLASRVAVGVAIALGTAGVGAGGAFLNHLLQDTPVIEAPSPQPQVQPRAQADVIQWLGEHGYDRTPGEGK